MTANNTAVKLKEVSTIKWKDMPNVKPWLRAYRAAKYRCSSPSHEYFKRGIKFYMTEEHFEILWKRDKAHLMKRPSIDRIFNNKDYTFDNCQYMELSKNVCKDNTGSLNVDAKLNEKKVLDIKIRYASGEVTQKKLAKEYGVHHSVIHGIMHGMYWKHVKVPNKISDLKNLIEMVKQ